MSRMRMLALAILALVSAGAVAPVLADVIVTKSGDRYEGPVLRENETEVVINISDCGVAEMPIKKSNILQRTKTTEKPADSKKDDDSKSSATSGSKGKATAKKAAPKEPPKKATPKKTTPKKIPKKSKPDEETTDEKSDDKGSSDDKHSSDDKRSSDRSSRKKDKDSDEE